MKFQTVITKNHSKMKRKFIKPVIKVIKLDNQIAMYMLSNPPGGGDDIKINTSFSFIRFILR
jgi:hypothetical protein